MEGKLTKGHWQTRLCYSRKKTARIVGRKSVVISTRSVPKSLALGGFGRCPPNGHVFLSTAPAPTHTLDEQPSRISTGMTSGGGRGAESRRKAKAPPSVLGQELGAPPLRHQVHQPLYPPSSMPQEGKAKLRTGGCWTLDPDSGGTRQGDIEADRSSLSTRNKLASFVSTTMSRRHLSSCRTREGS